MNTHSKTLIFVAGVMLGIVCGEKSSYASEVAMFALMLSFAQGAVYFWERKRTGEGGALARSFSLPLFTLLFSIGLFVGIVRVQLVEERMRLVCDSTCTFDAVISSSPETKNDSQIFKVHPMFSSEEFLDVQLHVPLYPRYSIGETLHLSGKVTVPGVIMPHGGGQVFDYASYLATKNVGSEMTYPKINVVDTEAHTVTEYLSRWKEDLISRSDTYVSQPASSLASGMLFGASSIPQDLAQTFRIAGLSHIIVLSGFNIAIVIASILFVLAFFPLYVRIVLATVSVVVFVVMVGAEPSVLRATLMAFVGLLALATGREYVARQALVLSFFAIVIYSPASLLNDVSLHLSFLATSGIVYLSKGIDELLTKYGSRFMPASLHELVVTTLSAYLATLPYVMYTFGTVSMYALIANILVLPFVPGAMLISFLVVASSYLSQTVSVVFGFLDTLLINIMIWIARAIELLPFSSFSLSVSFATMCVIYIFIAFLSLYLFIKNNNETHGTYEDGVLTDIISF